MNIDFAKSDGLVPVIVQDADTLQVLMLGYTNETGLANNTGNRECHLLEPVTGVNSG